VPSSIVEEEDADNLVELAETFCLCARDRREGLEDELFCLAAGRAEEDFRESLVDGAPAGSLVESFIPSKRTKSSC